MLVAPATDSDTHTELPDRLIPIPTWFDDGTLVIKAEDTEFKVYRGLLSSKSSIFRDMFALNPLAAPEDSVVELGDSASDLSYFLKALHDTDIFQRPDPTVAAPFAIVAGILRLSDKYDVPNLRKRAIEHLSVVYPTTLAAYDSSPHFTSPDVSDHVGSIKLARDFDIPWIRPMAIYRYVSRPLSAVSATLHTSGLSTDDVDLCIRGIRAFKMLQFLCSAPIRSTGSTKGCSTSTCANVQKEKWRKICVDGKADPLKTEQSSCIHGVCSSCSYIASVQYTKQEAWDMIPEMFNGTTWEVLEGLKQTALRSSA